jgi:cell wall-associated NlpC family hydrolase
MYRLKRLTISVVISIFSLGILQCLQPRSSYIDRRRAARESHLNLQRDQNNNYPEKIKVFLNQIKYYLGTMYKYGGNSRQGMDCSGFVSVVFRESFDVALPHNASQIHRKCQKIAPRELNLGDLVFFRTAKTKKIDHVGIYLVKNYFVHASVSHGVVVSELTAQYYRSRFAGAGRIINLGKISFNNRKLN